MCTTKGKQENLIVKEMFCCSEAKKLLVPDLNQFEALKDAGLGKQIVIFPRVLQSASIF